MYIYNFVGFLNIWDQRSSCEINPKGKFLPWAYNSNKYFYFIMLLSLFSILVSVKPELMQIRVACGDQALETIMLVSNRFVVILLKVSHVHWNVLGKLDPLSICQQYKYNFICQQITKLIQESFGHVHLSSLHCSCTSLCQIWDLDQPLNIINRWNHPIITARPR